MRKSQPKRKRLGDGAEPSQRSDYWDFVRETAAEVSRWPAWKRGANEAARREISDGDDRRRIAAPAGNESPTGISEPSSAFGKFSFN